LYHEIETGFRIESETGLAMPLVLRTSLRPITLDSRLPTVTVVSDVNVI